jgi:hypothetical protein
MMETTGTTAGPAVPPLDQEPDGGTYGKPDEGTYEELDPGTYGKSNEEIYEEPNRGLDRPTQRIDRTGSTPRQAIVPPEQRASAADSALNVAIREIRESVLAAREELTGRPTDVQSRLGAAMARQRVVEQLGFRVVQKPNGEGAVEYLYGPEGGPDGETAGSIRAVQPAQPREVAMWIVLLGLADELVVNSLSQSDRIAALDFQLRSSNAQLVRMSGEVGALNRELDEISDRHTQEMLEVAEGEFERGRRAGLRGESSANSTGRGTVRGEGSGGGPESGPESGPEGAETGAERPPAGRGGPKGASDKGRGDGKRARLFSRHGTRD